MQATGDYGELRPIAGMARAKLWIGAGAAIVAVLIVWQTIVVPNLAQRAAEKAEAPTWVTSGQPCPTIAAAWYARLQVAKPQPFAFEGVTGDRAHGDVSCTELAFDHGRAVTPFPVCQFSAPFEVRFVTPKGLVYFEPGVGQPVTVTLRDGNLACVLGANADHR